MDDTPSDEIECLCKIWKKKLLEKNTECIYVRNPGKRSLTVARNVGAEIAKGDIFLFLDNDVRIYPNYIKNILEAFERNTKALGVQGWIINYYVDRWNLKRLIYAKIFYTFKVSKNSCKFGEYPIALNGVIPCECLVGANMAYKRQVFDMGFRFDENLEKYAFMEDALFSHTLYKNYPGKLLITPYARCIHKESRSQREQDLKYINTCRKYVLGRLFGRRGLILNCWQTIGNLVIQMKNLINK